MKTKQATQRVRIIADTDPTSPREWDNVGKMVCWHRRYNLGDEQPSYDPQEWLRELAADQVNANNSELIPDEHVQRILDKHFLILPLYLYDHSGIAISCSSFSCPWDSGQVGYIYCTKERAIAECGSVEQAEKNLRQEVATYDDYLTGNVYGYIVEQFDELTGWDEVDSCWGFYGYDPKTNGMECYLDSDQLKLAVSAEVEYPKY